MVVIFYINNSVCKPHVNRTSVIIKRIKGRQLVQTFLGMVETTLQSYNIDN